MDATTSLIVGSVVGAVTSIGANALWHYLTSARVDVRNPELTSVQATSAQSSAHFWGAKVLMAPSALVARHPALAVQAHVDIKDATTGQVLAHFVCRWQGTPQPVVPTAPNQYVPNIAAISFGQRGDVYQHKSEAIDLFVKHDGDPEFYGFPNESYFHNWRHPNFRFPGARYLATLSVYHDFDVHTVDMEILNQGTRGTGLEIRTLDRQFTSTFGPVLRRP